MSRKNIRNRDSGESPEVETAEEAPPRAPVTELPDRTPKITIERAFNARMGDPLVQAFTANERARGQGVRRLTRDEWKAEYEAFLAAPRS